MKPVRSILAGVLCCIAAGVAQALPITDVYTPPSAPVTLSTGTPFTYQHDLIARGFDPLTEVIASATLTLAITGAGGQPLTVAFDGVTGYNEKLKDLAGVPLTIGLSYLQNDGLLNVTLTKGGGGGSVFQFSSSTLHVEGRTAPTQDVPEPASIALLGLGVLGLGVARRRRSA